MPIYDLSYRHWEGTLKSGAGRWWVIAEAGIRLLLAKRFFMFLLMLCWVPFFIEATYVYFELALGTGPGFGIGPWFFQYAFAWQLPALVLVTVYAGSGLIATDLAANALPIYFSKPITRLDYVAGKFAIIAAFLTLVFLMPVLVLFVFTAGVDPGLGFIKENYWLLASIIAYGLLIVAATSCLILALSSMARSGRVVGVTFMGIAIFSPAIGKVISLITGSDQMLVLSVADNISRLSDAFFFQQASTHLSPLLSLLAAGVACAWAAWVLSRRIRPVEVVA
ncbi:MAG: hypothetical protein ACE5IK_01485 [Acidobacteriota bacterium]